jgi:peptidoglycan/LPS O-acetylase OafA/YrhL
MEFKKFWGDLSSTKGKDSYLQGLRGIAIVLVIAFHGKTFLQNGYLGVDIFFVISGFVISRKLLIEAQTTSKISLKQFYKGRIFRLLPALVVLLIFSSVISFFVQTPYQPQGDQQVTAKSGLSGLFFVANFIIPKISSGYFGTFANQNSMTHLWSLGVEAQFYLLLPILLLIFVVYRNKTALLTKVIVFISISSIAFNIFNHTWIPFYNPLGRIWEFSLGVLCAIWVVAHSDEKNFSHRFTPKIFPYSGWFLLLLSQANVLPYFRDLDLDSTIACIGVALLILGFSPNKAPQSNPLESSPLIFLGNISYSLYLWHWPLAIFISTMFPNLIGSKLIAVVLSIIPATASTIFIEKRFYGSQTRHKYRSVITSLLSIAAFALLAVLGLGGKGAWGLQLNGMTNPFKTMLINCEKYEIPFPNCFIKSTTSKGMIMVVGDSQAESNSYSLFELAKERNLDLLIISQPGNRYFVEKCRNNAPCSDELTKLILKLQPSYLIINNLWLDSMSSLEDSNSFYRRYFQPFAGLLDKGVGKIIIVKSIPVPSNFGSYFTLYNQFVGKNYEFRLIGDQSTRSSIAIDRLISNFSGIESIDPKLIICKELKCSVTNEDLSLYRNATHLTQEGSDQLGQLFKKVLSK